MDPQQRMRWLVKELSRHQHLYYVAAQPEISDREYDRLFDELLALEKEFPQWAQKNSPTTRIGSDLDNRFPERPHRIPVLSLDKEYSLDDLEKWIDKTVSAADGEISFVVEEKIDGASIVLYYSSGSLEYALTRGNGLSGNDVSDNVRTIRQIPLSIESGPEVFVRGEIFIRKSDFITLNAGMEKAFANPRNLAAGTLRNIKSSTVAKIPLNVFVYEGHFNRVSTGNDHILTLKTLRDLGFPINTHTGFFADSDERRTRIRRELPECTVGRIRDLYGFIRERQQQRETLDYDIDGLVIKVNELSIREILGFTAHHPRWAVAYKFDAPTAHSRLRDIQVQVGRNGRVTPVAILDPTPIAGSTVSRATLHNQEYVDMLELGIGDTVTISKRGDVIPAVEKVIEKDDHHPSVYQLPSRCPFCAGDLILDGAHHYCKNPQCPERLKRALIHFVSRDCMDIETLGGKTIEYLFQKNFIRRIPDIYTFDYRRLLQETGFKEKKVQNIVENVAKSRQQPFKKVFVALGFEGLGGQAVAELTKNGFNSFTKLISAARTQDAALFSSLDGFGEMTAQAIIRQFSNPETIKLIAELDEIGLHTEESPAGSETRNLPFRHQTWVITGSFDHFVPRSRAAEEIEKRGGQMADSISKKTTHLLAGNAPGSKLAKARSLGITILKESEFLKLLEQARTEPG